MPHLASLHLLDVVRLAFECGERVVAEPIAGGAAFEALPWSECIPAEYLTGSRHVEQVEDGWLVAYESAFAQGFVFRVDEAGHVENVHYVARDIGRVSSIARAPRGTYLLGLECGVLRVEPEQHSRSGGPRATVLQVGGRSAAASRRS